MINLIARVSIISVMAVLLLAQTDLIAEEEQASPPASDADLTPRIQAQLKEQRKHLLAVASSLSADPQLAQDDYIQLGIAIAERFLQRVEDNDAQQGQSLDWSWLQVQEVQEVLDRTDARIKLAAKAPSKPERVPRPTGGQVTIRDGIFYTETTAGDQSKIVQRPYFFDGYGSFGQVGEDIPKLPKFGVTLVAQERGPNSMNADGSLDNWGLSILEVLKSAKANRIKVDFLLSPHYFPQWAIDQSPDVVPSTDPPEGPEYNIDHPKAREVIQRWLETIVPAVKDEPALFSFNLANEPHYHYSGRDPYSRPEWVAYLEKQHGTIAALNALYGKRYQEFAEVPVPDRTMPEGVENQRAFYDWVTFNQRHFADWFQWMNGIIKKAAPATPTHVKIHTSRFLHRLMDTGIDPELICGITDLAGNDIEAFVLPSGPYACNWQDQEFWFDLLHSFGGQPVFDSESHAIDQGSPPVRVPPDHVRSLLWQGAVHHLGAASIWVWHEPDPAHEWLKGTIYMRPANLYAAGQTMFDLNRLAPEVAAVSQVKPKVALLYSVPSYFWQEDYLGMVKKVYTALTFMGQPVTFVSERQLAEGRAAKVACIILPNATHVQETTVTALEKFVAIGGRVLMVGSDGLGWDEYHRPRTLGQGLDAITRIEPATDERHLFTSLRPVLADGGLELTALRNADDETFAWGVEYRTVPYREGLLVPLISFLRDPQVVRLSLEGAATDLLSNEPVSLDRIRLNPMQPRLLWLPTGKPSGLPHRAGEE